MDSKRTGKVRKLADAVAHHYDQLDVLRKSRDEFINAAAGSLYPHRSRRSLTDPKREVLNFMGLAAKAHALSLAAHRPRIQAISKAVEHSQFAEHFERAINTYAEKMHLEEVLQDIAMNAFFLQGIAKVSMADSAVVTLEADEWMDPGQPFVQSVSPNHFCYDTDSPTFRNCSFLADRYRVRFDDLVEDDRFSSSIRRRLKEKGPQSLQAANQEESLSPLQGGGAGQFEDFVYLCDVFLPRDGMIYTFACNERFQFTDDQPLSEIEWDGSETGPYYFLNLGPIPDKTTPSAPAANLHLCHNMINALYRKLEDQARDQKQLKVVRPGSDIATSARDATNGEYIEGDPQDIDEIRFDGPDQNLFGFLLNAQNQFGQLGGNLWHKLGIAATADTATQQGMIGESVGRVEEYEQEKFVSFVRKVVTELGRLLFNDQTTRLPMKADFGEFEVDDPWLGAQEEGGRVGSIDDYPIDIVPTSMKYRSPQQRLQELRGVFAEAVPLMPLLHQQGKTINLDAYYEAVADYGDLPEVKRMIIDLPPQPGEQQQGPTGAHERTGPDLNKGQYTHTSVNGGGGGDPNAQALALMGQGGQ